MKKILIIDDDSVSTFLLSKILTDNNFDTFVCYSGCEGITKLTNTNYNLVTMDIAMPILNGFDTIDIIRKFSNVPILIITAMMDVENTLKIKKLKLPFLLKPIIPTELMKKVKEIFE